MAKISGGTRMKNSSSSSNNSPVQLTEREVVKLNRKIVSLFKIPRMGATNYYHIGDTTISIRNGVVSDSKNGGVIDLKMGDYETRFSWFKGNGYGPSSQKGALTSIKNNMLYTLKLNPLKVTREEFNEIMKRKKIVKSITN